MRHLIVCCDGTWNRDDESEGGVPTPTNVRLFHNALADRHTDGHPQKARYFSGVGADGSALAKAVDGGTGRGLSRNIMNAYLWLSGQYAPGDKIAAVGFSRGAYTARSLIAMITMCGLLVTDAAAAPGAGWTAVRRVFRDGYVQGPRRPDGWWGELPFHDDFQPPAGTPAQREAAEKELGRHVEFIGVWETVGALGIPDTVAVLDLFDDDHRHSFHDTRLNPGVHAARHALALDERRGPFAPTPWTTPAGEVAPDDDQLVQRWFPGAHSDVGGGYREIGLSDRALEWMIGEASTAAGLAFRPEVTAQIAPNWADVLHESCVGAYQKLSPVPRTVPRVCPGAPTVDRSAIDRYTTRPLRQDPYRPSEVLTPGAAHIVDVYAHREWNEAGLYLVEGTYEFTATGEWVDRAESSGPEGIEDPGVVAGLAYRAADLLGSVETAWRARTGNAVAELPLTKRYEDARWMELVGVVANGGFRDGRTGRGHQVVLIGEGPVTATVSKAGYLYAFANDAWGMYSNNRGTVSLTVTRTG